MDRPVKLFIIALFVLCVGAAILNQQEEERVSTVAGQPLTMPGLLYGDGVLSIKFYPRVEILDREGKGDYAGAIKTLDLRQRSMTTEHLLTPFLKEQGMEIPSDSVWEEIESIDFAVTVLSESNQQLALPRDANKIDTLKEFHAEEIANIPIDAIKIELNKSQSKYSRLEIDIDYISPRQIADFEAYKRDHFFVLQSIVLQPNSQDVTLKLVRVYCPKRLRSPLSLSASQV